MIKKGSLIKVIDYNASYYKRYGIVISIEETTVHLRICIVNDRSRLCHFNWVYGLNQIEEVEQ